MNRSCKNPNRNRTSSKRRTVFNQIRHNTPRSNFVTPEMLDQMWMEEDTTQTSGVRITELNSSSGSPTESPGIHRHARHPWSYINNEKEETEKYDYSVNVEARSRRRMNMNRNEDNFTSTYTNKHCYGRDMLSNSNSFYETYDSGINSARMNHQMNCFTIINNQHYQSDSSTDNENCETIEIREMNSEEKKYWDHVYNEEVITYDPNNQCEQRTIRIYSYKNQRLLSENDFELVNLPNSRDSTSTSTSSCISDEGLKADKTACRLSSPIPDTFIPRLDLVQTLSTVTELSEPLKPHSKVSTQEMVNLKLRNNWLSDRNDNYKQKDNLNVVNWMALSPRERRRRSINTNSDTLNNIFKETGVTYAEGDKHLDQVNIKSDRVQLTNVQEDIHANEKESDKVQSTSTNTEYKPVAVKKIADILPIDISYADADIDSDHDINVELDYSNKPFIKINSKHNSTDITDPIEKLNSHNWISDERNEVETRAHDLENAAEVHFDDCSSENVELDSASRRLWAKHMQLMKSQQWTEYLPITCSPPSLQLSISLSSVNCRKSWFRRLTKCLKCCK